jgi:4-carboxymuconolactone decarboxylase
MAQNDPSRPRDAVLRVAPKLHELTQQILFGDVWERRELSKRDRVQASQAVDQALSER